MSAPKIDLIRQALSAAESSIKLARQLLLDVESEGSKAKPRAQELPGVSGFFDGQNMFTEKGETYPVPENYASKSILVVGDTLKLVEDGGERRFKQIEHVKRHKSIGILSKKEGKWVGVTPEGSYKLLPASVSHFNGEVGDEALLQLPASNLQVPWAAVEKIMKKGEEEAKEKKAEVKVEQKPKEQEEKKETKPKEELKAKAEEKKEVTAEELKEKEAKEEVKENPPNLPVGEGGKEEVKETIAPVTEKQEEEKQVTVKPPEEKPVAEKPPEEKPVEVKPAAKEEAVAEVKPVAKTEEVAEDELT